MGWKGTLRKVNAASKHSARQKQGQNNAANRASSKLDKNIEQVMAKASSFEKKLISDPIKTLGLRYDEHAGFTSTPFQLSTELFNGEVSLTSDATDRDGFNPQAFNSDLFAVTPLDFMFTRWGLILAIRIENFDPEYQLRTSWHKKTDPESSSIFLLDSEYSNYYYPIASNLSGVVLHGHPRIGLVAFELFRQSTNQLKLFISDVKMSSERGKKYSFEFDYLSSEIATSINASISQPSLTEELVVAIEPQVQDLRKQISSSSSSGCMLVLSSVLALVGVGIIGWQLIT